MNNDERSTRSMLLVLMAALATQCFAVWWTLPGSELLSDMPLFRTDNAAHWYRILAAGSLMSQGVSVSYDPFFGAGSAISFSNNPGAKFPALAGWALKPWFNSVQIWKLYVVSASLVAAICIPIAACVLKISWRTALLASIFGIFLWWISLFRWYHTAGLVSYVLASYLTIPYLALAAQYVQRNGSGSILLLLSLGLLASVAWVIHPLFPVAIAFWCVGYAILCFGDWRPLRFLAFLLFVPVVALSTNWFWVGDFLHPERVTHRVLVVTHQAVVDINLIWREMAGLWQGDSQGSKAYLPLMVGALASALLGARYISNYRVMRASIVTGLALILYAAVGASFEPAAIYTQPNRFAPLGYLFLTIPAAQGVSGLWQHIQGGRRSLLRSLAGAILAALAFLALVMTNEFRRELSWDQKVGHYGAIAPRIKPLGPITEEILEWLTADTTPTARILFETSNGRVHDGQHIAGYLAYQANREFIGGHYPRLYFADFYDGEMFGRKVEAISQEALNEYFDRYNIGWAVAHSVQGKQALDEHPAVDLVKQSRGISYYVVNRPHSITIQGQATVAKRGHNRLVLEQIQGDTLILKYHYLPGLTTEPPTRIEPIIIGDDPDPFIKIHAPPPRLTLLRK